MLLVPIVVAILYDQNFNDIQQSIINKPYYYVQNNSSDIDLSFNKGTHSNFTAQQYGPDSTFDNLTEENVGMAEGIEDYVDNNLSNIDSNEDKGTHSNFTAQLYGPDSVYDNLLEEAEAENWISDWQKRKKITIDYAKVEDDLIDFPILVNVTDTGLRDYAQSDGDDILFTESDGTTKLSHEIETYTSATGGLVAWVKVPTLSSISNTILYMYYGNLLAANQQNVTNVWSNNYEAVYHLNDGSFNDSTSNVRHGTNYGSSDTTGKIAGARDFNPADGVDYISIGDWNVSGNQLTLQAWINPDNFAQDDPRVVSKAQGTAGAPEQDHVFMLSLIDGSNGENRLRFRLKTGTSDTAGTTTLVGTPPNSDLPSAGSWYLAAAIYNGSNMQIVRDDLNGGSNSKTGALRENSWAIQIGNQPGSTDINSRAFNGKIDEVRISSAARSASWLTTEYNNQYNVSSFFSIGIQEEPSLNYKLDLEVQWTNVDYSVTNGELCIYGGTMGSENIRVDAWNGSDWNNIFSDLISGWNNVTVTPYITSSAFTIRFRDGTQVGDISPDEWQIDITLIHVWTEVENYELDHEVQWANVDYSESNEELCIYGGTVGAENILVDAWNGSNWVNVFSDLSSGWNNVTVTSYLTSSTFTIRFKGGTETSDSNQDSWAIDATLLHVWS